MTAALIVIVVVLAVGVVGAWLAPSPRPVELTKSLLDQRLREQVVLTLKSGEAFRGVLFEADDKVWVLRSAEALGADTRPVSVDGELVIPATNVAYANKP